MQSRHLLLYYLASLLLHVFVIGSDALRSGLVPPSPAKLPQQVLHVSLRHPITLSAAPEALIKNTRDLDVDTPRLGVGVKQTLSHARLKTSAPPVAKLIPVNPKLPLQTQKQKLNALQKKLVAHTFYPPEAIARGLEGDVAVILVLDERGGITDVQIAASSGYSILDNAALKAAWAIGPQPDLGVRQIIRKVSFHLE